ncbi:cell wall hydrolase [Thermaerobacter sp. PB12/4term]|uniref:cell wall hydrolase n=1 Tax=Thermaerobacter sp. PB12/4term TaxID=2293838 RepID=UPI000E32B4AA|nr:cell wall hydrolase [Thermaerobacter sp. PB12/4term]QIA26449.1 cell wall hydrolase [Thermaerobacter sp. PB12/4term]
MRATAMEQATPAARSFTGRAGRSRRPGLPLVGAALALAFVLSGPTAALAIAAKPSEKGGVAGAAGSGPVAVTAKAIPARAGEDEEAAATGGLVAAVQLAEERAADRADKAGAGTNPAGPSTQVSAAAGKGRQEAAGAGSSRERGRTAGKPHTAARAGQAGSRAQVQERAMHLTPRELRLLAQMIEAEAGAEPYEGKVAVGAVILNRVRSPLFPDTVEEVIFQPWQFEPILNGWFWREPSAASWRAARDAARGVDPTGGALYFWNPAKSGYQPHLESRPSAGWIGNHRFAY